MNNKNASSIYLKALSYISGPLAACASAALFMIAIGTFLGGILWFVVAFEHGFLGLAKLIGGTLLCGLIVFLDFKFFPDYKYGLAIDRTIPAMVIAFICITVTLALEHQRLLS